MKVEIAPHEKDAIHQLVLAGRAMSDFFDKNDKQYAMRLRAYAQMAEDVLERMDAVVPG